MALYIVTLSRMVRDLVGATVKIEAVSREAAETEAIRRWEAGEFELEFIECMEGEPIEADADLIEYARAGWEG